jgi:spore coat protein U-like protein
MRVLTTTLCYALLAFPCWAASCSVSTSGVAFGSYDSLDGAPADTSGSITVSCTGTAGEVVNASISTTPSTRNLQGPKTALAYQLYVDAARTQPWGDGTSGTTPLTGTLTVGSNGNVNQSFYVYGRIAGGQHSAAAGSYLDTLVVTLGW